ncbi:unnamed protein product [Protopolystoma xenopodis]|uniref:Uncharacterized protein n=1 Tax=Protopolystoma xenopodis TaxID=117903 RepID=A0A3S5BBQ0_9PLAT|nr:unnamed protein product [Protopolystoma xenopodis]
MNKGLILSGSNCSNQFPIGMIARLTTINERKGLILAIAYTPTGCSRSGLTALSASSWLFQPLQQTSTVRIPRRVEITVER